VVAVRAVRGALDRQHVEGHHDAVDRRQHRLAALVHLRGAPASARAAWLGALGLARPPCPETGRRERRCRPGTPDRHRHALLP